MRRVVLSLSIICSSVLLVANTVMAAPAWLITEPPVTTPDAGPPFDPAPGAGQWFKHLVPPTPPEQGTDVYESRPWEFYDNKAGYGGGSSSTLAIRGYATNIVYSNGNIVAFNIEASITNDLGTEDSSIENPRIGTNRHGETLAEIIPYVGDMWLTKFTADFAIDQAAFDAWGGTMSDPYRDTNPYIIATNHDQLAWYCYPSSGEFLVPTWDFFNDLDKVIYMGETHTRLLSFTVSGAGLTVADPRYDAIVSGEDILSNRTTSLKISTWIDDLSIDDSSAYPVPPLRSSDCSVFFIPEPATLILLAIGGLALRRRRR